MGIVLALLAFAFFFWGLIGLAIPKRVGFASRWWALFALSAFLPLVAIGVAIDPPPPPEKGPVPAPSDYLIVVAFWAFLVGMGVLLKRAIIGRLSKATATIATEDRNPDRSPEQVDQARHAAQAEARRKELSLSEGYVTPTHQPKPLINRPQRSISRLARPGKRSGKVARFVYVDADGVVTDREIVNWRIVGTYISGYCTTRQASRDFRLDRVDEWIDYE